MIRAAVTLGGTAIRLARRPSLWSTALRQLRRTTPPRWWRQRPFLPGPSGTYLEFRLLTQYGDHGRTWEPDDVVNYLTWCRNWDAQRNPV